ncbi:unnamed protein product, partial [Cylicocyclus nassatus]
NAITWRCNKFTYVNRQSLQYTFTQTWKPIIQEYVSSTRMRTFNYIFLLLTTIVIFSAVNAAVGGPMAVLKEGIKMFPRPVRWCGHDELMRKFKPRPLSPLPVKKSIKKQ